MSERAGLIILTGLPGIGKTTLVRKICDDLSNKHKIACNGFYTEEVRDPSSKSRIGFDIVTLNNQRGILSRESSSGKGPYVGKYCVHVTDFEDVALPSINLSNNPEVVVIDEVGKMELKSKKFEMSVQKCIMKTFLLATVPFNLRQPLHLVDKLKNHPQANIIVVTKQNRNHLQHEIVEKVLNLLKN